MMGVIGHSVIGDARANLAAIGLIHPRAHLRLNPGERRSFAEAAQELLAGDHMTIGNCPHLYEAMVISQARGAPEWCLNPDDAFTPDTEIDLTAPVSWAAWWIAERMGTIPVSEARRVVCEEMWALAGACDHWLYKARDRKGLHIADQIDRAWRAAAVFGPMYFLLGDITPGPRGPILPPTGRSSPALVYSAVQEGAP